MGGEENPIATLIAIKDSKSKAMRAYLISNKGGCEQKITNEIAHWINSLGYKHIIVKSDREPSIVAVQDAVKEASKIEMVPENTPKGESKSNGNIESAVRELEGMIRSLKDAI